MHIAFLGLGNMGSAVARRLRDTGYELSLWNRTASAAAALAGPEATVASTPAEAVRSAQVVFSMVHDDRALESIFLEQGALEAMPAGAIHVSLSTISVSLAERLQQEHAARGQGYVGAPVFGRPNVAAAGKLWLVVAGSRASVEQVTPVLETFSRGITVVGERPALAHAVKLGGNFLITAMIASLAESVTYAEGFGVDPGLFLETVNTALFQSPFYEAYGKVMLHPPEEAAATVALGLKDTHLFREAAGQAKVRTPLAELFERQFNAAVQAGGGGEDWAAGYLKQVRSQAQETPESSKS